MKHIMLGDLIFKLYQVIKTLITRRILIECDRIPYQFHNVPLKKILNWIRVEVSIFRKPGRPWGWPTHLQIEPTTYCNLRCAFCPVTEGMGRPTGHMDFNLFKKVIDEIGDYVLLILLWDWGEPFLNSSIYEMISYAKQRGIKAVSSTNGHPFTRVEHADRVVRSGLDTLIVAMDGISQETYERFRQGGNLKLVLQGIRTIVARKRALNSKTPLINLRLIVMKHNEHEIPQLKNLARSLGVDVLTLKTLNFCFKSGFITEGSNNEFLPKDHRYRRFKYSSPDKVPIRLQRNPCKSLWNNPAIHWEGTVCPCTFDPGEKHVLGDLKTDTFEHIWFGTPYRKMRRQFRRNWEELHLCRECSYAYEGGNLSRETIADAFFFDPKDMIK